MTSAPPNARDVTHEHAERSNALICWVVDCGKQKDLRTAMAKSLQQERHRITNAESIDGAYRASICNALSVLSDYVTVNPSSGFRLTMGLISDCHAVLQSERDRDLPESGDKKRKKDKK